MLLALLTMFASTAAVPPADDAGAREARRQEGEARLQKVHQEIEELRRRLEQTESASGSILDAIEELDLRMALLRREAESLGRDMKATSERARAARREAETLESRLAQTEIELRDFLRETYKVGPARYVRVVTAATSPAQVAAGYRAIDAMTFGEAERIESYRRDRARLEEVQANLEQEGKRLAELRASLDGKTRELKDVRGRKGDVLAELRGEQTSQRALLGDLVQVESQVRALLERLSRPGVIEAVPSLGLARYRGQLGWPVRGKLLVPFGNVRHPRFSTEVPHPGIDIAAAPGQEVRAVFDGRVLFSDWFKGYGQMVVIDHGDSYLSIYGHVDERLVVAGQDVTRGDIIARSGQGGSFEEPALYFEIRHEGRPEDPAQWLRGATRPPADHKPQAPGGHRVTRRTP